MRLHRVLATAVACVAATAPVAVTAPAIAVTTPTVVAIRAAHHPGYDRVVFQFDGGLPSQRSVRYVSQVIADPSGMPVAVAGNHFAVVRMFPATAHTGTRFVTPSRLTPALPNLRQIVRSGDFEGVLSYALGLRQRVPLHLFTLTSPARVVVDIPVLTWPVLRTGSRGANVLAAQYLLRSRGYRIAADGVFGPRTASAVTAFERAKRLPIDGVIGARVWSALITTVRYGSRGDAVRALQVELRKNALAVTVDGIFGVRTLAAVKRAQSLNSLPVDGIVGSMTWTALVCRGNAD